MISKFEYTITDPNGLHARPTGILVKKAQGFSEDITIECNGKSAGLTRLLAVMGLGVRCGDTVSVTVEGKNASQTARELQQFFKENF